MILELNIFDLSLDRVGTIDSFAKISIERNYYARSVMLLTVDASDTNVELLNLNNIITTTTNINYGYIIRRFLHDDEGGATITIAAYSLNHLLDWRTIVRQERRSGNVEDVLKAFIANHCITPVDKKRIVPRLTLGQNSGIAKNVETTVTGKNLEVFAFDFCQTHEITVDILINHDKKMLEVYTWQGKNLSEGVAENSVKFSEEFENVVNIHYLHDLTEERTTAYIAGEGEGAARQVVALRTDVEGLTRRELFVDARDLQTEETTDNRTKVLTPEEYKKALENRGEEKLAECKIIETFEGEVVDTQFVYGVDYSLGDVVSFRSDKLNRILHTRVTSTTLTIDDAGKQMIVVSFGDKIPDILDKIKKAVKQ